MSKCTTPPWSGQNLPCLNLDKIISNHKQSAKILSQACLFQGSYLQCMIDKRPLPHCAALPQVTKHVTVCREVYESCMLSPKGSNKPSTLTFSSYISDTLCSCHMCQLSCIPLPSHSVYKALGCLSGKRIKVILPICLVYSRTAVSQSALYAFLDLVVPPFSIFHAGLFESQIAQIVRRQKVAMWAEWLGAQ